MSDINEKYTTIHAKTNKKLESIYYLLKSHKEKFEKSQMTDWGYVGDLNMVNEELSEIEKFLKNQKYC